MWQQREQDLQVQLQLEQRLAQLRVLPGHLRRRLAATSPHYRNRFLRPRPRLRRNSRLAAAARLWKGMRSRSAARSVK